MPSSASSVSDGPDLAALLATLDRYGVAYVVGGSVAAMAHGAPDVIPGDLDVIPATDPANLARLADALGTLGAEVPTETGEWQTDEAGEHVWVKDGIERPQRPLDPHDSETFDHSFAIALGRLDVYQPTSEATVRAQPRTDPWCGHGDRERRLVGR